MKTRYTHPTRVGLFSIVLNHDGRWQALFEGEALGSYSTSQQALDDLASGASLWPSCGDPSQLSLPDEIADWR